MQLESSGRAGGLGLHDAVMTAFGLTADGTFHLDLQTVDGQRRQLLLRGVTKIGLRDFISGLIVSDVFCWSLSSAEHASQDAWRVLLGGNCLERDLSPTIDRFIREYPSCSLILLESSYGGTAAAICRSVSVEHLP